MGRRIKPINQYHITLVSVTIVFEMVDAALMRQRGVYITTCYQMYIPYILLQTAQYNMKSLLSLCLESLALQAFKATSCVDIRMVYAEKKGTKKRVILQERYLMDGGKKVIV